MSKGDWVYNGSRLREDGFAAQFDGSIISLITDPDALVDSRAVVPARASVESDIGLLTFLAISSQLSALSSDLYRR